MVLHPKRRYSARVPRVPRAFVVNELLLETSEVLLTQAGEDLLLES